ncbi:acriflavine resistance protein B [Phyllobacterium brassicacearum]|uniref:Acriflavine resistance protein B n=1 Tax=Phyllobacterium brassicacearum TaxID=314235 RepID=A0A2P7BE96_9HYPH|nr:efflux RND transporter permease subunit [Phyllobacterium brassicacearum]PSH64790.1 acriflavine resistance protein B [Phyllobacterium brassicacearum]TDQ21771.1 HAE1 family hydrophobic/amphiphilic exporter-1 [Phyllobacterium brassicacearum]
MNISSIFIRRPIATILLSVALAASGLFAYRFLPVAALPEVDFPIITVSAKLPGAAPDTMANAVATPLIKQFSTIQSISTISSTSTLGSTQITLEFDLNRNIDQAAADVEAAIASTLRKLPPSMTDPPSYRKTNPADAPVVLVALQSDTMQLSRLDDYAENVMSPAFSTIAGVGEVQVLGTKQYAVRIEVDPNATTARGIGLDDLTNAVAANNSIAPVGTISSPTQQMAIEADTQAQNADTFRQIIIASPNGKLVRLSDVARVIDSVATTQTESRYDGKPSLVLAVFRQPGANTVDVVDRVKAILPQFTQDLGPSASIHIVNDRSQSIRQAVSDVQFTLILTIALVIMVIFVFLRRLSATMIPIIAVPLSLIATLGAMYVLGFSIDNISLLGLTLSVGLVVDDAIVMLENITRHIEDGMSPFEAAMKGSAEIGFTIISITTSLVAVFIPILLMGGVVGRIFNEFAVVVTVAIMASALISLTLTPMLCSHLRGEKHGEGADRKPFTERVFDTVQSAYARVLDLCLRFRPVILAVFVLTVVATVYLFSTINKGFLPTEDIGQLSISTEARQDISFDAMVDLQKQVADAISSRPYVAHFVSNVGGGFNSSSLNQGRFFVELKPKSERAPLESVLSDLRRTLAKVPGINSYPVAVQNLRIGGVSSNAQYQYVLQSVNAADLYPWSQKIMLTMQQDRQTFIDVSSNLQNNALQANLVIDQDKAHLLGINSDQLRNTLYYAFGTNQASTIFSTGDSYQVILELDPAIPWTADKLDQMQIRSTTTNKLIPLSAFAHVERKTGLLAVSQLGQLPAVTISFNLPQGVSLGQALQELDALKAHLNVPSTITSSFTGTAQVFQQSLANQGLLVGAAILTIYIVLGILYESFVHPLTILTGLPAAAAGALATLELFGYDLSVIAIIGILMLIGIVKKNAIMMIDFALVRQRAGETSLDAIREACLVRFRPIMMTTFAALMGTIPIAIGAGASSELRQPLGVAVVGGLVVSQILTLFITPVLFLYMEDLSHALRRLGNAILGRQAPVAAE